MEITIQEEEIGDPQAAVLQSTTRLGRASAGEVADDLTSTRELAYTTIGTTLDRLHKKGFLVRETVRTRRASKDVYSSSETQGLQRRTVNKAVDKVVMAFGSSAASIYGRLDELSPEETEKLKGTISSSVRTDRVGPRPPPPQGPSSQRRTSTTGQ